MTPGAERSGSPYILLKYLKFALILADTNRENSCGADHRNTHKAMTVSMDTAAHSNRVLDKIISTIGDLPATPAIIASLMQMTSNINTDIDKITRVIQADQSLAAKVLRLSNSSFYGRAREVRTLKEAIVILGFMTLHSLVIATSTQSLYRKSANDGLSNKLWEHAFAGAIASRLIARASGLQYHEEAFISGLLHDIGKLVLSQKMPEDYRQVVQEVENSRSTFVECEVAALGFHHADVGFLLLQKWSFPEELTEAVRNHHDPAAGGPEAGALPHIINLGNFMAKKLEIGFNDHKVDDLSSLASAGVLALDAARLETIQGQLEEHFRSEMELFSLYK